MLQSQDLLSPFHLLAAKFLGNQYIPLVILAQRICFGRFVQTCIYFRIITMFLPQAMTPPHALATNKQTSHGAGHPAGERARNHGAQAKRREITAAIWGHGA